MNPDKFLLHNVSLGLKLTLQSPDFFIVEQQKTVKTNNVDVTSTSSSKLLIKEIKLFIRHANVQPDFLFNLDMMLSKKYKATYEWKYGQIVTTTIPHNQSSYTVNSLYNNIRPCLLLICFSDNTTFIGDKLKDPMNFTHHGLK